MLEFLTEIIVGFLSLIVIILYPIGLFYGLTYTIEEPINENESILKDSSLICFDMCNKLFNK